MQCMAVVWHNYAQNALGTVTGVSHPPPNTDTAVILHNLVQRICQNTSAHLLSQIWALAKNLLGEIPGRSDASSSAVPPSSAPMRPGAAIL
jgi:hypothetical protein